MDVKKLFRDDLKTFESYNAKRIDSRIKLHANESPFSLSDTLVSEVKEEIAKCSFNRYPDAMSEELCKKFGEYIGVDYRAVVAGNGSDELIQIIVSTFLDKDDKILILNPEFSMYENYAAISSANIVKFNTDENFTFKPQSVIDKVNNEGIKLFFISNPNNPTGKAYDRDTILDLVKNCNSIVVVDEAYGAFYGESVIKDIDDYENLIVLKTCSKIGGASIRLGFLTAGKILLDEIKKVKSPYNVSTTTEIVGKILLSNKSEIHKKVKYIVSERERVYKELLKISYIEKVYKSSANFILVRTKIAEEIYSKLLEDGVLVRDFGSGVLKDCIRITIGKEEENNYMLDALKNIMANLK